MSSSCCGSGKCCQRPENQQSPPAPTSVALPSRSNPKPATSTEPVWAVESPPPPPPPATRDAQLENILGDSEPLVSKCGADARANGQCCRDLKGEDERHLIPPEIVRDVIIGLSDGLTVPFALTAGLSSLGSSSLVVTGGLAELCAGAISMGLGGYLASQAELDHFHYLRRHTQARVLRSCAGEMDREVHSILGPLGVKEPLSRLVAEHLREVEDDAWGERTEGTEGIMPAALRSGNDGKKKHWLSWKHKDADVVENGGTKGNEEMGLTAFLLKFGEGLEEVPVSRLYISALTIGLSYFIGGLIPLIPYMATSNAEDGLIISCILTGLILFVFGGFKTYFTGATGGAWGYIYGATSTMVVGGVAAGAAFGLVKALGVKE